MPKENQPFAPQVSDMATIGLDIRKWGALARWRGTLAYVIEADNSPYHDPVLAPHMGVVENDIAVFIAAEFSNAYSSADLVSREILLDRLPLSGSQRYIAAPSRGNPAPATEAEKLVSTLIQTFQWLGQYSYAKGIDRSPSHDRQTRRRLAEHPNDLTVDLIRAWERGWDEANRSAEEAVLDRQSIMERPAIISARLVRNATPKPNE